MEVIKDIRQKQKVKYNIKDILIIALFATLANANTWEQTTDFALCNKEYLKKYIKKWSFIS